MNKSKNYENDIREIEQLLDLVEKVDERIRYLERSIISQNRNLFALLITSSILILVLAVTFTHLEPSELLSSSPLLFLLGIFIAGLGLFILVGLTMLGLLAIRLDNQRQLEVENRVMGDLVRMLPSLIERIKPHISSVTHATMEMRLRRIRFTPSRILSAYPIKVKTSSAKGEMAVNEI